MLVLVPRDYDCADESTYYLQFLIDHYDSPLAEIYIFIHAHEVSYHYSQPICWEIERLLTKYEPNGLFLFLSRSADEYLYPQKFGGVNCNFNRHFPPSNWGPSERLDMKGLWSKVFEGTSLLDGTSNICSPLIHFRISE